MKTTYYLVYKLTNLVNGKIYIGCHMTKDMNDGYMGSGKRLGYAKKKYGVENFKKEILSTHETPEQMLAEEKRLVTEEFLGRDDVYNLNIGGRGSWFATNLSLTPEQRTKAGKAGGYANRTSEQRSATAKLHGSSWKSSWILKRDEMEAIAKKGILAAASKISIEKRKETFLKINHQKGENNSQSGTCWILNDELNLVKKIKSTEIEFYLSSGWKKGRKFGEVTALASSTVLKTV